MFECKLISYKLSIYIYSYRSNFNHKTKFSTTYYKAKTRKICTQGTIDIKHGMKKLRARFCLRFTQQSTLSYTAQFPSQYEEI